MKSLEELRKIKERVLKRREMAGEGTQVRVVVAMGTCGIAAGARDTLTAILSEIEKQNVSDVIVTQTGCMGLCEYEPIVLIQVGGNDPVTYGKISPECVPALIEKQVFGGETVTAWLVKQG